MLAAVITTVLIYGYLAGTLIALATLLPTHPAPTARKPPPPPPDSF
jgi:hypothetical protein